jgi:hypothetical protein
MNLIELLQIASSEEKVVLSSCYNGKVKVKIVKDVSVETFLSAI